MRADWIKFMISAAQPETLAVDLFGLDELPELCTDRTVVEDIERAFEFCRSKMRNVWID